jgi:hypothetical protein
MRARDCVVVRDSAGSGLKDEVSLEYRGQAVTELVHPSRLRMTYRDPQQGAIRPVGDVEATTRAWTLFQVPVSVSGVPACTQSGDEGELQPQFCCGDTEHLLHFIEGSSPVDGDSEIDRCGRARDHGRFSGSHAYQSVRAGTIG